MGCFSSNSKSEDTKKKENELANKNSDSKEQIK